MSVTSARVNDAARTRIVVISFAVLLAAAGPGRALGEWLQGAGWDEDNLHCRITIMNGEVVYNADGESKQRGGTHHGEK
jgi:hypothetical protein